MLNPCCQKTKEKQSATQQPLWTGGAKCRPMLCFVREGPAMFYPRGHGVSEIMCDAANVAAEAELRQDPKTVS